MEYVVEDPQASGAGLVLTSGTTSAPAHDPRELARSIEAGLARGTQDLAHAARRVRAGSDPEAIHDLRVAARRLLIALRVWEPLCRVRLHRVLTRQLRRERRRFGSARELEMNVAWLESRVPSSDVAVSTAAIAVLERMKRRLTRQRRQAASRLRPRGVRRLIRLLTSVAPGIEPRAFRHPFACEHARGVERELGATALAAVRSASADDESLHRARIAMKKWRYAAECLEEASVSATSQSPTTLRQVQEALGTAHDRAVLRDALRGFMRRHPEQPLEALIEELEAERQAAVQQFRELTAGLIPLPADAGPRPAVHRGATALWDEGERERLARWLTGRAGSEEPQERERSLAPIGEPRKVRKFSERDR